MQNTLDFPAFSLGQSVPLKDIVANQVRQQHGDDHAKTSIRHHS
jgi:hypothetical protein